MSALYSYASVPAHRPEFFPVYFPHNPSPIYVQSALPPTPAYVEPTIGVEYHLVQQLLRSVGTRLYQGLQHVGLLHPISTTGRCIVRDLSINLPTHILEISGIHSGPDGLKLRLPCHGIVYAADCSNFPPLPRSSPVPQISSPNTDYTIELPVVQFQVPSCRTFMILHEYLHTKRGERLIFQLLDLPPNPPLQRLEGTNLVERMTRTAIGPSRLEGLLEREEILRDVANNGYALGIVDLEFWRNLNFAHQVVVRSIQACQATTAGPPAGSD